MVRVKCITIVLAKWCPHCVPLSLNYAQKMAKDLGVSLHVLDIDFPEQEIVADDLVEKYGDYVEDYIIPQVFLEYEGEKVDHLFTGFSEGVSVTEARWNSLLDNRFYQSLLRAQKEDSEPLTDFVERHLTFNVRCRGHCDAPASFKALPTERGEVVGVYHCLGGFVSRVVYFSLEPDLDWFYTFLSDQLGKEVVEKRDLRLATRHGWELDEEAAAELERLNFKQRKPVIREVYWTRYPKTDAEKSKGVFLCSDPEQGRGCGGLFIQEVTSKNRLCPKCR